MKSIHVFLICLFFGVSYAQAEDVARHTGQLYEGCGSISNSSIWLNNTSDYSSVKDGFIYVPGGCGSLPNVAQKYLKVVGGEVVEMSQAEKDTLDANEAAFAQAELTAQSRSGAKNSVDELSQLGVLIRAFALEVIERTNATAAKVDAIDACNTDNSTAAAVKACITNLDPLGQAKVAQLKTQIKNRIDAGSAD